jgi:flagella basal body P-ring formation protein FlgA
MQPATGDTIRLRRAANVSGPITLEAVATLEGKHAKALGDTVIASPQEGEPATQVTIASVREALDEKDVNWARLSLAGFMQCRVQHAKATKDKPMPAESGEQTNASSKQAAASDTSASSAANVTDRVQAGQSATLGQRIRRAIETMAEAKPEALKIQFSDHDAERLSRSVVGKQYELEPQTTSAVGRVPIVVRRYQGGRIAERFTISATVERRFQAVVAQQSIGRGETFDADSVAVKTVWLQRGDAPVADPALVQGQQADGVLRKEHVIFPEDVKSPTLVKRGQLITVRCLTDGLVVRTVGRARSDGARNDTIKVRNESSRETFTCKVTGPRRAVVNLRDRQAAQNTGVKTEGARP